jgi:hypothetical protein
MTDLVLHYIDKKNVFNGQFMLKEETTKQKKTLKLMVDRDGQYNYIKENS